jgi:4-amino-4-deoxy-L-arabinose transferase-like glycosyltransferase
MVLLAALPRLLWLDLAEFKLDEATHYQMAYWLTRGACRWVGSTASVGVPKPPLFVYVLSVPLVLTRDPRVVTGFLGILAAMSAGAFYLILRRQLGRAASFSAALLFVANPQAILFARKLFTADLLPALCTLLLGAGSALLAAARPQVGRWAVAVALALSLLLLTTFSPVLLLPAVLALFWLCRDALSLSDMLAAAVGFALPFVPYLLTVAPGFAGQLASGPLAERLSGTSAAAPGRPPVLRWVWALLFGAPWPSAASPLGLVAAVALLGLTITGAWWLLHALRTKRLRTWAVFVAAWLGLAPLLAWIAPFGVQPHYLVVLYPTLFVLPAAAVQWAAERHRRWLLAALAFVVLIVAWQGHVWYDSLQAVARGVEGYGTPLGYWWRTTQQARSLMGQHGAEEVLLVMPGDERWDEKAHILDALLSSTRHRVVDGELTVVFPPHPTVMVIASEVERAGAQVERCTLPLVEPQPASPFGGTYDFRLWSPTAAGASLCVPAIQPLTARWASGTQLRGLATGDRVVPDQPLPVTLLWRTTQPAPGLDVHWFSHLVDAAGLKWGQFDHAAWPTSRWQPGDEVLTFFDLPVDPGAPASGLTLRVGQYHYPDIANIPVLDEAGQPASDALELSLP